MISIYIYICTYIYIYIYILWTFEDSLAVKQAATGSGATESAMAKFEEHSRFASFRA